LLLPFLISRSQDNAFRNSAPSALIAFAGHNTVAGHLGEHCQPCGTEVCACYEGETPENPFPDQTENKTDPNNPEQGDPNPGPLALLIVLALLVWRFGR
jgi:hypothetical protein